ncbi:hypothetical protein KUTeg_018998 [Tegillarca granosa]|uniref:Bromo domain-containing protein n=1 Tax=Tegillarca granosa TaxID=220873 RepID=A0ABQ9EB92_TEGGR|nr:hypothetical protein KUTeg_018998 [Tegillarca granosa]
MMGKKHKKHHKSEKRSHDEERSEKEPLRLVLKVNTADSDVYSDSPHEGKKHKHKKKKKKKSSDKEKHRHEEKSRKRAREEAAEEEMQVSQEDEEEEVREPVVKKIAVEEAESEETAEEEVSTERPTEDSKLAINREDGRGILRLCLKYLQKNLQKKDTNGFFAYPVNDVIAPGYSSIILNPMDFNTMFTKITNDQYRNVLDYKKDFVLMCNNAMTYNRPETIYYKEAKRLLHTGMKLLSKDKLLNMKRTTPWLASITMEELGIDEPDETGVIMEAIVEEEMLEKKRAKATKSLGRFEAFPDNLSPEDILAQAQAAARDAADMLTLRKPNSRYGFLRRREDGSTSMTILNPENEGIVSETEKVVNLGSLVGKLTSGTGSLATFKEDKRNKITPINYLNYGPFSSYAPSYDSTFSNLSKEDSDLMLSTYGDETGVDYAKSVMSFVENAGDYAISMVDHLLDILTKGEHTKVKKMLEKKKKDEDEKTHNEVVAALNDENNTQLGTKEDGGTKSDIDINSLRSLGELGVDVSFLDNFDKESKKDPVQEKLDQTASLLNDLQQTQYERLGGHLPSHLGNIPGPSEKELLLAQKVTKELKELAKEANPAAVVSTKAVRSAMGITYNPITSQPEQVDLTGPTAESVEPISQDITGELSSEVASTDVQDNIVSDETMDTADPNDSDEIDISEFLQLPQNGLGGGDTCSNSVIDTT